MADPTPTPQTAQTATFRTNISTLVREETFEGKPHNVAPMVMLRTGVANNVLYTDEALGKFAQAWNGRPIMLPKPEAPALHPNKQGTPVSANSPGMLEEHRVGMVFNACFEDGKLKAEAWIDPIRANAVDPALMTKLAADQPVDVSTGMWQDELILPGQYGGVAYQRIAANMRSDHLLVLPSGKGACSWDDGAGLPRVNAADGDADEPGMLKRLLTGLAKLVGGLRTNELSHDGVRSQIRIALHTAFPNPENEPNSVWLRDVFDSYAIYERTVGGKETLWKQAYTVGADDTVTLNGDAVQVVEKRDFVPVPTTLTPSNDDAGSDGGKPHAATGAEPGVSINTEDPATQPKKGEVMMERKDKVDALITNAKVGWGEDDREFLTGLADAPFEKLAGMVVLTPEAPAPAAAPAPTGNAAPAPAVAPATVLTAAPAPTQAAPVTMAQFMADAPAELTAVLNGALAMHSARKTQLVEALVANASCDFTKETLEAKDVAELETLAKMASVPVQAPTDFSGRTVAELAGNAGTDEAPPMPGFKWGAKATA